MARTRRFHSDEYCDPAIAAGLRLHRVDVTTNPDAGLLSAEDEEHIAYARDAGRVLFTRDEDFLRLNIAGMDRSSVNVSARQAAVEKVMEEAHALVSGAPPHLPCDPISLLPRCRFFATMALRERESTVAPPAGPRQKMEPILRSLILKRFRSIPAETVPFGNPTFLVGQNGSGKSNFVDAFAFLAEAMASPLQAVFDRRGGIPPSPTVARCEVILPIWGSA